jgi:hypothetical protein
MEKKTVVCYIILLFLMALLASVYHKYNASCREYFSTDDEDGTSNYRFPRAQDERLSNKYIGYSEQELLDILEEKKSEVYKLLCQIKYYLEVSIGFNQNNVLRKDAKDGLYKLDELDGETSNIGGTYDYESKTTFNKIVISDQNEFCEVPMWKHDVIVDKDSIVVYIEHLSKEYNKHVLILNNIKVDLSTFLNNFKRLLNENMDNKLMGQCDRCTGPECAIICGDSETNIIDQLKKNQLLIDSKKKELDNKMCNYIKNYRYVEDVRGSIVCYVNKLNDIWSKNEIKDTKVRLNYARNNPEAYQCNDTIDPDTIDPEAFADIEIQQRYEGSATATNGSATATNGSATATNGSATATNGSATATNAN